MKRKAIFLFCIPLIFLLFYYGGTGHQHYRINLRFNKNYPGESLDKQKTGLMWALSFLGAELPKGSFDKALVMRDSALFELNLEQAGFNANALAAFKVILHELKKSEEYEQKKGIDLGEFIIYTLGSSWHYYKITGAETTLAAYQKKYDYSNAIFFPVLRSDVAFHHRMLQLVRSDSVKAMSFMATEGNGSLEDNSFEAQTYEVFDVMPNGQLRFAVYDRSGNLSEASEKQFGNAGKPVKCLWCHEMSIQPLFSENKPMEGYMTPAFFNQLVADRMLILQNYRRALNGDINFDHLQDHALMELLYITFMQPSLYKLQHEWDMPEAELAESFSGLKQHDHAEHQFLKNLYERGHVKSRSPYKTVILPDSIWEPNAHEPDLFK